MSDGWIYSCYEFVVRFISTVWSERHILYSNRITDSDFRPLALQCLAKLTRETCSQRCILHCEEWERYERIRTESSMMHGSFPPSHRCALAYCQSLLPPSFFPANLRSNFPSLGLRYMSRTRQTSLLHDSRFSYPVNDSKAISWIFIIFPKRLNINIKCIVIKKNICLWLLFYHINILFII